MMHSLLGRTLYEKRWFLAGWSLVFGVMSTLVIMFYPSFSQGGGFDEVAKTLPSQFQGFIGDPSVFRTIDGFIASQIYDIRLSLMISIMSLVLAVSIMTREEENGNLRTLLTTPLSRTRIALEKFVAALVIIMTLNMVTIAGIYIGTFSIGETASHMLLLKLYAVSCLFGITAFSIPYAIALATSRRVTVISVGLCIAIGGYVLATFSRPVAWLKGWDYLSLMHYFDTNGLRTHTYNQLNSWTLGVICVAVLIIGIMVFRKRDIN